MGEHKYVDLGELVGNEKIEFLEFLEASDKTITRVTVRNKGMFFSTVSKRQLWQAVGLEYIEPELLDYIDSLNEGEVFFDIGASNGGFSVYAGVSGLKVYAFEPEAQNYSLMEMNNYLNSHKYRGFVKAFNIALSDGDGISNMYIANYEAGGHMKILGKPVKVQENDEFKPAYVQPVITFGLDEFIGRYQVDQPNHMKIDVDGAEWKVIQGAKRTIEDTRLKSIFIELVEDDSNNKKIRQYLDEKGFSLKSKHQVQRYDGLFNYVFKRT